MEKVFSPADEEGHSVSSSSPSTHRLIPLHQRRFLLCACCGPVFLTPSSNPPPITLMHAASDVCTQHTLLGNLLAGTRELCTCFQHVGHGLDITRQSEARRGDRSWVSAVVHVHRSDFYRCPDTDPGDSREALLLLTCSILSNVV